MQINVKPFDFDAWMNTEADGEINYLQNEQSQAGRPNDRHNYSMNLDPNLLRITFQQSLYAANGLRGENIEPSYRRAL